MIAGGEPFLSSLDIDARNFPLRPGTQFLYDGTVSDVEGTHRHRVIFTVTDLVKQIGAVKTRLRLTRVRHLDPGGRANARTAALRLDRRASSFSASVYRLTPPAALPPG